LIIGPAGCGKSTLLAAWRRERVAAGAHAVWIALTASDDDPARFFDALVAGLGVLAPVLQRHAALPVGSVSDEQAAERLAIALVRGLATLGQECLLLIDDAHHLHHPHILLALQLLLDHGPETLHCAFASRSALPLSLARLRDQGLVAELGLDDLRFTLTESTQLLQGLLGHIDERQARMAHALTDGWAAGLSLLGVDLRRGGGQLLTGDRRPLRDARAFASYFDAEVLTGLNPTQMQFAVLCALPEQFNAALCAALAGDAQAVDRSLELLAQLEAQGLFLMPAGTRYPPGWWRLHPLLRDVLRQHLERLPQPQLHRLNAVAWRWFADCGMLHDAVHHALQSGDRQAAADLVEACADGLFVKGELRRLVGLARQLPDSIVDERASLRLWVAWGQVFERRLADADRSIAQLQIDLAAAPAAQRYRLTLLRGLQAVQRDDTAGAIDILPELLIEPPQGDAIALTGRRNLLTWLHLYRGEYEQARRVQLEPALPPTAGQPLLGTPFGLLGGRCLVGLTHAVQGQMIQAERIYRDVLFEADRGGAPCIDASCLAAGFLGEVLYELNEPLAAIGLLEARADALERVAIPDTMVRVMIALNRACRLVGRPLDGLACVKQFEASARQAGLDRVLAYCLLELVHQHLLHHDTPAANSVLCELTALEARHGLALSGTHGEIPVVAERARIELALHGGALSEALQRLHALIAVCQQRGRGRRVPFLQLQAAFVLARLGDAGQSQRLVQEALAHGHRLGLVRTLLDAHADSVALIDLASRNAGLDPVLHFYAERLLAAARDTRHVPGASSPVQPTGKVHPLQQLSPREAEIAQLLCLALPNKKIAHALGLSLDTVKWHMKNIFAKLGVSERDEVVQRLRDPA